MARACVCKGVPVDLEENEFEYKNGDRAGEKGKSVSFKLDSPAVRLVGSLLFETNNDATMAAVRNAHDEGREVEVIASPQVIRSEKVNDRGRPMDWVKMTARSVV